MYIDKENFVAWMERIMDRLDMQDKKIDRLLSGHNYLNGEKLLDNQEFVLYAESEYQNLATLPEERNTALLDVRRKIFLPCKRHTQVNP